MFEHYKTFHPKPKNTDGLKKVLQLIRNQLPQDLINKATPSFTKTHRACVKATVTVDVSKVHSEKLLLTLNIDHYK